MRSSIIGVSMAAFLVAGPAAGQEIALDTLRIEWRAPAILAEAREFLGHDGDAFVFARLRARTANQAARYCELEERYHQALEDDFTRAFEFMFGIAMIGPTAAPDSLGRLAFNVARQYAEQRMMMSVTLSAATESEQIALSRACMEAKNAVR